MTPKDQSDLDQAEEALVEMLPRLWRRMYVRLIEEGFDRSEAMGLLKQYIMASLKSG